MKRNNDIIKIKPEIIKQLSEIDKYLKKNSEIDQKLIELLNVYVSQINGCAYCLNAHINNAKKLGVPDKKLYLISVWKETQIYSEEERVALNLARKVTDIGSFSALDREFKETSEFFSESGYVDLLLAITNINTWNRLMIGTGATVAN